MFAIQSFPLRISSVNVTKSDMVKSDMVTFSEVILNKKLLFFCAVMVLYQNANAALAIGSFHFKNDGSFNLEFRKRFINFGK